MHQNCTRMLADVPNAKEACATCDDRMKCATIDNAQKVMDTEAATLCTVMTGLECDHVYSVMTAKDLKMKPSKTILYPVRTRPRLPRSFASKASCNG